MRICIILRYLWVAGAPKIAIHQVAGLIDNGYNAKLLILAKSPRYQGEYDSILSGIPHICIKIPKFLEKIEIFLSRFFFSKNRPGERVLPIFSIFAALKYTKDCDILLCHDPFSGAVGFLAKILFGKPYIVYVHDPITGIFKLIDFLILRYADVILSNSDKTKDRFPKAFREKIIPCPPGLPVEVSLRSRLKFRFKYILSASRWDFGRRPDWILDVANKMRNFHFVVTGYWQNQELLEEFIAKKQELKLDNVVVYTKPLPEEVFEKLVSDAYVIVHVNVVEGLSMVVWEGIHRGVPAVVNVDVGSADYIKKFGSGIVIDSTNDVDEIIHAIETISNNYVEYIINCLKLAREFSISNHAKRLLKIVDFYYKK